MDQFKNWVRKRCHEKHDEKPDLSTYTITRAFVWVCLARAQRLTVEKTSLLISLDVREMLHQIVPMAYFGCCVLFSMAEAKTEDLMGEDGVLIAAQAITEVVKRSGERVFDGVHEWINRLFSMQTKVLYSVSDASSFKHYKIDFGWGLPMKMDLASIDKGGAFSISDYRDTDGVEVGVALAQLDIEKFSYLFSSSF